MPANHSKWIDAAEVVLPGDKLDATLAFFTDTLGFRIDSIFPADAPRVVVISGYGVRVRLQRDASVEPGALRLTCRDPIEGPREYTAPNGTRVELVAANPEFVLPPLQQSFVLTKYSAEANWGAGRAGMQYRDLVPDRQGGRFIASHIRIPQGGPVPDYVHHHAVRFQMIYCYRGEVRVVYEDQGEPFALRAGDCVLQPPHIRHRVLECSPGLEVIEVSCPAEHETRVDHDLRLPTPERRPERDFGGQRFVRHVAAEARWEPWRLAGFDARDLGIAAATRGLAGARVVRATGPQSTRCSVDAEFLFLFVLAGSATLRVAGREDERITAGDAFVLPSGLRHGLDSCSDGLELLEVSLPAAFPTTEHVPN